MPNHARFRALVPALAAVLLQSAPGLAADLTALRPGALPRSDFRARAMEAFGGPIAGAKAGPLRKIGLDLAQLHFEHQDHLRRGGPGGTFRSSVFGVRVQNERVVIDVVAEGSTATLKAELVALGMQRPAVFGRYVSGWLPITALDELAALHSVRLARPAYAQTRSGAVTSQGDAALGAALARADFGVDGTGVTVGTLSDSFDCRGGAAADVVSGDLPADIAVLAEETGCVSGSDEGRAVMQIIHDLAPGSAQAFHTAFGGMADFASGIVALATTGGAQVINDDAFYFAEPMFQDGPIAQAVDAVKAMGVAYFSAAGNNARQSYQAAFVSSGQPGFATGSVRHDFDPGAGIDGLQQVTISGRTLVTFVLQWDQPYFSASGAPGSASDVDIILYNQAGIALAGGIHANIGGDPVEIFGYFNPSNNPQTFQIGVELFSGPAPDLVKYIYFGDMKVDEYDTQSATVYGHAAAAGGRAVGAVRYDETPAFGVAPPVAEAYSSAGGVPILFDTEGGAVFELRQKPEIMAVDGVDTTFFGFDYEPNGYPNFFGTSAAAPHAAAVAALLMEFAPGTSPDGIYAALQETAADMDAPGVDFNTGYGLIRAGEALASVAPAPDADGDGVPDATDNCVTLPNGPLLPDAGGHSQLDTDADGFGNRCDADLDGSAFVNAADLALFRAAFGTAAPHADLDGSGFVNAADLAVFRSLFGQPPGPSGLAP